MVNIDALLFRIIKTIKIDILIWLSKKICWMIIPWNWIQTWWNTGRSMYISISVQFWQIISSVFLGSSQLFIILIGHQTLHPSISTMLDRNEMFSKSYLYVNFVSTSLKDKIHYHYVIYVFFKSDIDGQEKGKQLLCAAPLPLSHRQTHTFEV